MSTSNAIEPLQKHTTHPPPQPPSLSSLPDDIVLSCLALVPRSYHPNISWVSKKLRSLVRSPELNVLRSTLHKNSIHVCLEEKENDDHSLFHWFTLNATSTKEYTLVPNPTPFPPHPKFGSSAIAVGSKILFIGGSAEPSTDLWILDTRYGNMNKGPSMSLPRVQYNAAVGVIDGKIYVIGGRPYSSDERFHEEIEVEVYDPKSETWKLAGEENVLTISRCRASMEGKVYMVEYKKTSVYNPRESEGERMVHMVSQRLSEGGRRNRLKDVAHRVCVVEDVLFAIFNRIGLMWFDTKLNVWRRLLGRDGKELSFNLYVDAMAEYEGRLLVYVCLTEVPKPINQNIWCMFVSLDRAGGKICGTIHWFGILATVPLSFRFLLCLTVSE